MHVPRLDCRLEPSVTSVDAASLRSLSRSEEGRLRERKEHLLCAALKFRPVILPSCVHLGAPPRRSIASVVAPPGQYWWWPQHGRRPLYRRQGALSLAHPATFIWPVLYKDLGTSTFTLCGTLSALPAVCHLLPSRRSPGACRLPTPGISASV